MCDVISLEFYHAPYSPWHKSTFDSNSQVLEMKLCGMYQCCTSMQPTIVEGKVELNWIDLFNPYRKGFSLRTSPLQEENGSGHLPTVELSLWNAICSLLESNTQVKHGTAQRFAIPSCWQHWKSRENDVICNQRF